MFTEISVKYLLSQDQKARLDHITELWNKAAQTNDSPEKVFAYIMQFGCSPVINTNFDTIEDYILTKIHHSA